MRKVISWPESLKTNKSAPRPIWHCSQTNFMVRYEWTAPPHLPKTVPTLCHVCLLYHFEANGAGKVDKRLCSAHVRVYLLNVCNTHCGKNENQPDKIVAFIFIWVQEAIVKGCLMEGLLSAPRGRRGSAQRSKPAPGRRYGRQSWYRQAAIAGCCQGPWGHNISRIVTIPGDGVAPTTAVCGPCASRAAATCAGHRTRPTGALLWPVAWHHAKTVKKLHKFRCVAVQNIRTVLLFGYFSRLAR